MVWQGRAGNRSPYADDGEVTDGAGVEIFVECERKRWRDMRREWGICSAWKWRKALLESEKEIFLKACFKNAI